MNSILQNPLTRRLTKYASCVGGLILLLLLVDTRASARGRKQEKQEHQIKSLKEVIKSHAEFQKDRAALSSNPSSLSDRLRNNQF